MLFSIWNEFIDFSNAYEFFQFFFTFMKIPFLKKIHALTVGLLVQSSEILVRDMESYYKWMSKIRNVSSFSKISKFFSKT